jgi:hypothetical protein
MEQQTYFPTKTVGSAPQGKMAFTPPFDKRWAPPSARSQQQASQSVPQQSISQSFSGGRPQASQHGQQQNTMHGNPLSHPNTDPRYTPPPPSSYRVAQNTPRTLLPAPPKQATPWPTFSAPNSQFGPSFSNSKNGTTSYYQSPYAGPSYYQSPYARPSLYRSPYTNKSHPVVWDSQQSFSFDRARAEFETASAKQRNRSREGLEARTVPQEADNGEDSDAEDSK